MQPHESPPEHDSVQDELQKIFNAFVIVSLLTFCCFLPDLGNALLDWDDSGYIYENRHIKSLSLETVRWAFGEFYLNYWAPLTWLSLAVDHAFWGVNPTGYHLTNNILHSLNAGMFFLICLELLKVRQPEFLRADTKMPLVSAHLPLLCALLAALVFAIHPLRVESVAWATERKDVLSLFFGLPAVLLYIWYTRRSCIWDRGRIWVSSRDYWLALVFFSLSLMSKSLMVMLPVVLLVLDWFPLGRMKTAGIFPILIEKVPFFLLSGAASLITLKAQSGAVEQVTLHTKVLNAFKSIIAYLGMTIWPFDLSPFYMHPVSIQGWPREYILAVAVVILTTFCCLVLLRRRPIFMAVWLIYLVTLLPFLGFTQIGPQAMAGRFTYLSGLPLALLFSIGVTSGFVRFAGTRPIAISFGVAVVLLLLASGYLTVREIAVWKDDVSLWARVIDLNPHGSGRAYSQRSYAYRARGDYQRALADINEAIAIATRKNYRAIHDVYRERGGVRVDMGDLAGAIADYTTALETATGGGRRMILYERGTAYRKYGRDDLSNDDFRQAGMAGLAK